MGHEAPYVDAAGAPGAAGGITFGNAILAVVTLIIGAWVSNAVYNIFFHPLAHIPGPFIGKITNLGFIWEYIKGNDVEYDKANFEKYGMTMDGGYRRQHRHHVSNAN